MTHSIRLACVSVALVAGGAAPQAVLYAQENGQCAFLCAPELKIEPTFTIENLFNPARVETIEDGVAVDTTRQGRDRVFELVVAADVPTEIPRMGFTLEAIFSPFRDDTEVELELELNLTWLERGADRRVGRKSLRHHRQVQPGRETHRYERLHSQTELRIGHGGLPVQRLA